MHANGFHKVKIKELSWRQELYEPFFDGILERSNRSVFGIRAIWAFDIVNQGASGVRNESKLGDVGE